MYTFLLVKDTRQIKSQKHYKSMWSAGNIMGANYQRRDLLHSINQTDYWFWSTLFVRLCWKQKRTEPKKNILVFSEEYHEQAIHQAGHVYHSLFWQNCNEIIVRQTGNASLSGQTSLILWYYQRKQQFLVHLATKNEPFPTLFSEERQFIHPRFLEQKIVPEKA